MNERSGLRSALSGGGARAVRLQQVETGRDEREAEVAAQARPAPAVAGAARLAVLRCGPAPGGALAQFADVLIGYGVE
jgi:hypothetical protein